MANSALESMLPQLNGKRKPRLGLEHIRTFPPFGAIMNGEIVKRKDEHFLLTAEMVYFDKQELITLEDGTKRLKEYFSEGEFPFIECADEEISKLSIATDPANRFADHTMDQRGVRNARSFAGKHLKLIVGDKHVEDFKKLPQLEALRPIRYKNMFSFIRPRPRRRCSRKFPPPHWWNRTLILWD